MLNRIDISGNIGEDEKDAFNYIAENYTIPPSLAKIPGFNTKLLKACEELGGVITFNYPLNTFSILVEGLNESVESVEDEVADEESLEDDLPPSVKETTVEDEDDDDWA